jgi:hypothetical protein
LRRQTGEKLPHPLVEIRPPVEISGVAGGRYHDLQPRPTLTPSPPERRPSALSGNGKLRFVVDQLVRNGDPGVENAGNPAAITRGAADLPAMRGDASLCPVGVAGGPVVIGVDEERIMTAAEPSATDAAPASNESREPGLWLWHGETLRSASAPPGRPRPRIERTLKFMISAARSAWWMAPLGGLALIGVAAWLTPYLPTGGQAMPGDTPAVALQPASSPSLSPPIGPVPAAGATWLPLEQLQAPSASIRQAMVGPAKDKPLKRRTPRRSRVIAGRPHALFAHRWTPAFLAHCPYQCSWAEAMRGGD